jgi:hypothetical protein
MAAVATTTGRDFEVQEIINARLVSDKKQYDQSDVLWKIGVKNGRVQYISPQEYQGVSPGVLTSLDAKGGLVVPS